MTRTSNAKRKQQESAASLRATAKRKREQRKQEELKRKQHYNLRPRHPVASMSRCATEESEWQACPPEVKCKTCKAKFKPLRQRQLAVKSSKIHCLGLFLKAQSGIQKERIIIHVEGKTFPKGARPHTKYSYGLTNGFFIEPTNRSRFINHSSSPNSRIQKWKEGEKERLAIVAECSIGRHEEITFDYGDNKRSLV
jgi:hypothetical protein